MFLKLRDPTYKYLFLLENKEYLVDTLCRRTKLWDTVVPCGCENSHYVVKLNSNGDQYYLLTPYPHL